MAKSRKEYDKKYYERHKEEIRKKHREYFEKYYAKNKWKIKEYRDAHKEEKKEYNGKYRENHREELTEYDRNRYVSSEKRKIQCLNHNSRHITLGSKCQTCGSTENLERHHNLGYENPLKVMTVCRSCHKFIESDLQNAKK